MARRKNDYFLFLKEQAACLLEAAKYLDSVLNNYDVGCVGEYKEKMHKIEKSADEVRHGIISNLASEFITPIDSEDILRLAQITDDITDSLDEVVMELYMYCIKDLPPHLSEFCGTVLLCVRAYCGAVEELANFKKPARLRELIVEVNTHESEADERYYDAVHALFEGGGDALRLMCHKALYDRLEDCADLCEDAADIIEQIIIKNS